MVVVLNKNSCPRKVSLMARKLTDDDDDELGKKNP